MTVSSITYTMHVKLINFEWKSELLVNLHLYRLANYLPYGYVSVSIVHAAYAVRVLPVHWYQTCKQSLVLMRLLGERAL